MKQNIYSIYDRATMEYAAPFFAMTDEAAIRAIRGAFGPQSQLVLYPADYVVKCIGFFDSETGAVDGAIRQVEEIKALIPVVLRDYCLDGTFGGVHDETP